MLADVHDRLALDAAQQCRALRIELEQKSKMPGYVALSRAKT